MKLSTSALRALNCRTVSTRWGLAAAIGYLLVLALPVLAADPDGASTSRRAREEAIREIPFNHLSQEDLVAVNEVINNTSIYRRMPTRVIDCDPHLYLFLVRHPDVITNIWDIMEISDVTLQRTGADTFRSSDGKGTTGNVKVVYDAYDKQLVYAEGSYQGPLVTRPIQAQCVLLLQSKYVRERNGRYYVTCQLDSFVHMDRVGYELLAKTFQPLIHRAADINFVETMSFVSTLSRTAELNPDGATRIAARLQRVDPKVRDAFAVVAGQVAERAALPPQLRPVGHEAKLER